MPSINQAAVFAAILSIMTEPLTSAFELSAVTYVYPKSQSGVWDVSITIPPSSIYGLVGINGAGKTTLMRVMVGLLHPQKGSVSLLGGDLNTDRRKKLSAIGSLIEIPSVYQHLTGREHLRIFAEYTSAPLSNIEKVLDLVGITEAGNRRVGQYSLGMKQRLALATALLHDPAILVLDEPTNGLDPLGIAAMRELLNQLSADQGKTIIVSSHQLAEVQKIATHIGIVHQGEIRFQGKIEDLTLTAAKKQTLRLKVSPSENALNVLKEYKAAESTVQNVICIPILDDMEAANIIKSLVEARVDIYEAIREENSLERDFLNFLEDNADVQ